MKPAVVIENIGKKYRITSGGNLPYLSLRDTLARTLRFQGTTRQDFWALKEVSFSIQPGESIGIIGKNGAGKSTLLKILSRITGPTTGQITYRGRIASLLEVGTGFHPELTGKENIFFSGSLLGLTRQEIIQSFDAIVDFSGVEKFLNTPIKHYSSGMQLRLAFSVAAFLRSEILVVDEVLAVGDAEFQKKCMGKMNEISGSGRTILFVSHNMGVMQQLCQKIAWLDKGQLKEYGEKTSVIRSYLDSESKSTEYIPSLTLEAKTSIKRLYVGDAEARAKQWFGHKESVRIYLECQVLEQNPELRIGISIQDDRGFVIFTDEIQWNETLHGYSKFCITLPSPLLTPGQYFITSGIHIPNVNILDLQERIQAFEIRDEGSAFSLYGAGGYGCVYVRCEWKRLESPGAFR